MKREHLQEHLIEVIAQLNEASHLIHLLHEKIEVGPEEVELKNIEQDFNFTLADLTQAQNRMKNIAVEFFSTPS